MRPSRPLQRIAPTFVAPSVPSLWPPTVVRVYHALPSRSIILEPVFGVHWCGIRNPCIPGVCSISGSSPLCTTGTEMCPSSRCALNGLDLRANHLGIGVYATKDFAPGDYVGEYAGVLTSHPARSGKYTMAVSRETFDGQPLFIDASLYGNAMRFVNHSCEPNSTFFEISDPSRVAVVAYAHEHIPAGSEITVHYSSSLWFTCQCGTSSCSSHTWTP